MRTLLALSLLVPALAFAGAQRREPIDPVVLATLSARMADKAPETFNFRNSEDAHKWIYEMSNRLQARIPDRTERIQLLKTIQFEAVRNALDPQLVLGVIEVESAFRRYAVSSAGARGLMQVMPFWTAELKRPHDNLFHRRLNVRYGCLILRYYLDLEKGDLYRALGRYNGSLGQPGYPNLVLSAWHGRWKYDGATS
jgi:soluble lytic murein transglycosylase-like protein